ncbi:MAG: hypothetical protein HRF50_14135 [Phycisphaerae bacterium]|jgi:hypothetical protein
MQERLDSLVRQLIEIDELFGDGQGALSARLPGAAARAARMRWLSFAGPLVAAAVLGFLMVRAPTLERPAAAAQRVPVSIARSAEHGPTQRINRFQSCADEDAYAMVVFRAWSSECDCIRWRLHEFADGSVLARLSAGGGLEFELAYTGDPPNVEQMVLLAVARRAADLPSAPDASESFLECLDLSLPPELPGASQQNSPAAVLACVPNDVYIVPHAFFPEPAP